MPFVTNISGVGSGRCLLKTRPGTPFYARPVKLYSKANIMNLIKTLFSAALLAIILTIGGFAQTTATLTGQVTDTLGAIVVGATVTVVAPDGKTKSAVTNAKGEYTIPGLPPGKYAVKGIAPKFALYENPEVTISATEKNELIVILTVGGLEEKVDVNTANQVTTDPTENASATVIKGADLDALPDDPDELAAALQALAGAAAGPNGGQMYIDGFTGGQMPPKESIREIRINQNPFSAEFDRIGFGRIEILTKPGSDKWRGSANGNFNDESLNSRNPFALNRAPTQQRSFGGNISGPIKKGKSSFNLEANHRSNDNNTIINAQILDAAFNIVPFRRDVRVPNKRFNIAPRVDYAINDKNTLVARYSFTKTSATFQGLSETSLLSRAYATNSREHEIRLTESMIINPKTVNETRFEYSDNDRRSQGDNSIPSINAASSFISGGSNVGLSFTKNKNIEVNNFTSTSFGKNLQHSVKWGGRLRHVSIDDRSESNFSGSYTFAGFFGTDPCDIISRTGSAGPDGLVSSIEQYRCKAQGLTGSQYNPSQFSITTGNPLQSVKQTDYGVYITDDWKWSPALLLSFGLRYENQTNISSNANFAPRFGFAWSPGAGGAKTPKTVFRGGGGVFYDRVGERLTLDALRYNGINQLNLTVSAFDPNPARAAIARTLLSQPVFTANGVTNSLTPAQILAALPQSNTTRQLASNLQTPYSIQGAFSVEHQFPFKTTVSATFVTSRTLHSLRARNINAPVCAAQTVLACTGAPRPFATNSAIYEYESSGNVRQNQFRVNFRTNVSPKFSMFGNYGLSFTKSDADGTGSFPAYTYDLSGEWGRAAGDIRHNFTVGGNIVIPWNISLNPFVTILSGRPFNITRGTDDNLDLLYTERPTFAQLAAQCSLVHLSASFCDIGGHNPNDIIPRNYGQGPNSFTVNLRVGKNIPFGKSNQTVASNNRGGGGGNNRGGGGGGPRGGGGPGGGAVMMGGGGGPMMMMMGGPGGDVRRPYNLNIGVNFNNLFNTVNYGTPVGSLASSRFGQFTSTSGGFFGGFGGGGFGGGSGPNRRIDLSVRLSF